MLNQVPVTPPAAASLFETLPFSEINLLHSTVISLVWRGNEQTLGVEWHMISHCCSVCLFAVFDFYASVSGEANIKVAKQKNISFISGKMTNPGKRGGGGGCVGRRKRWTALTKNKEFIQDKHTCTENKNPEQGYSVEVEYIGWIFRIKIIRIISTSLLYSTNQIKHFMLL